MHFYMPVRVFDERDCVLRHAKDIARLGKKALIVTGKSSSRKNGSLDDVMAALEAEHVEHLLFSEVEENPSTETVLRAKDLFSDSGIDLVIGVGGGSALDAAKAVALVLKHPGADLSYLYDATKDASALPVVCVPTTCGTGSEVTGVSVLTRHDKRTKISMVHKIFPVLALVDGKYLKNAPAELIVNTSVDALAHLYESVLNAKADDYTRMTASAGLRCWAKTKEILTKERTASQEDFDLLMRSSLLAGMSIAQSGTSLPHALSYALTYDLALPHGKAVGIFLPAFLKAAPEAERDELLQLAGFSGLAEFAAFIDGLFGGTEVPEEERRQAFEMVAGNAAKMKSASFPVDEKVLETIAFG